MTHSPNRQRRLCAIPPRIRAFAKIVLDSDADMYPEFFENFDTESSQEIGVSRFAVQSMSKAVFNPGIATDMEWADFRVAYADYASHLREVDISALSRSGLAEPLSISKSIDREAIFTDLSMSVELSPVYEVHHLLLNVSKIDISSRFSDVFQAFVCQITSILRDIEGLVSKLTMAKRRTSITENKNVNLSLADKKLSANRLIASLPPLTSSLLVHAHHFEWFVKHATLTGSFDAAAYITDLSALELWCLHIGRHNPACVVERFLPLLSLFPEWARNPMRMVLENRASGVVSVYSLNRLLALWGPFMLVDRNMARDLSRSMINLTETTEIIVSRLAEKEASIGSFCFTLSNRLGVFDVQVCTAVGHIRRYEVDHSTGAWVLGGLSRQDFEAPTDAAIAFPQIFKTPVFIESFNVPAPAAADAVENLSIIHRACFRNNVPYVAKLIERGGSLLINSAILDPSICRTLTWTPLICAVNNPTGDPVDIVEMLLSYGADPTFEDDAGCTALYYTIVNRYSRATQALLKHCKSHGITPHTSRSSVPLFLALGAHAFNVSNLDNLRVCDTIPHKETVQLILAVTPDLDITRAGTQILEEKLENRNVSRTGDWNVRHFFLPTLSEGEARAEEHCIQSHTNLCRQHWLLTRSVLHAIYAHSYFLSARCLLSDLRRV